jgi:DNA-binding CsgD family transcriptional regulator
MTALARGDEQRILRFVAEADSFGEEHPFGGEFLTQLGMLVPARWIGFVCGAELDYFNVQRPGDEHVFDEVDWAEATPVLRNKVPTFVYLDHNFGAVKLSDFWSRRELLRSSVYKLVLEPAALEHSLSVRLPMSSDMSFVFDRGDRDFTERDREVLLTLTPHLARLYEAAETRRRLQAALAQLESNQAVDMPREREVLELVAEGHTNGAIATQLWISPGTVRKHLDNLYNKLGVHTRTAAAARLRG